MSIDEVIGMLVHTVEEARAHGWEELENGDLMDAVEVSGFEVMVTTDKNSVTSRT